MIPQAGCHYVPLVNLLILLIKLISCWERTEYRKLSKKAFPKLGKAFFDKRNHETEVSFNSE